MSSWRSSAAYKIAANYAAVFAWSILLLGAGVYLAVHTKLDQERDRQITEELGRLSRLPSRAELLREIRWRAEHNAGNRFQYSVFDDQGKRIAGTLDIQMPAAAGLGDEFQQAGARAGGALRIGVIDTPREDRIVVSLNAAPDGGINDAILRYSLATFFALMAISAFSGWILARYLQTRLRPITVTADAIVTGEIDLRVPITGRGDEFDAAGQALNLMLDRVAGLMENLRQVSSDIAHDMRKPLIRLLCQADRLGQVDGAEDRILEIGDEMLALFAAILRIAEVEGGGLERNFERINFSALMAEVAESFAPALADAGNSIEWIIEPEVEVLGSQELLAQLAANLLDNARIHTPKGTAIKLVLASDEHDALLSVEDNGPGVSEADRKKLLQRFFRADASRMTPGNGLGLSLVAAAAGVHGGSVSIADAAPGLRVLVSIPKLRSGFELEEMAAGHTGRFRTVLRRFQWPT